MVFLKNVIGNRNKVLVAYIFKTLNITCLSYACKNGVHLLTVFKTMISFSVVEIVWQD